MLSRPVTADYSRLSNILQQNIQAVLQGKTPAQDGMEAATKAADRLR
jgi:multiple sugar transport system substrate-binding protein